MQNNNVGWSETEQTVFQEVLDRAYVREANALIQNLREIVRTISHLSHVSSLHDYLGTRLHEINDKYNDRNSFSNLVLAQLLYEGWLTMDDLTGLDIEKIVTISVLAQMGSFA